jgi:hypothetical protein
VHAVFRDKTVWKGEVEVFQLFNHPITTRCYAWSRDKGPNDESFVSVLETPPVNSAKRAVQVQILKDRASKKKEHGQHRGAKKSASLKGLRRA